MTDIKGMDQYTVGGPPERIWASPAYGQDWTNRCDAGCARAFKADVEYVRADLVKELTERLERAESALDDSRARADNHCKGRGINYARAVDAEAALAEACKVIEPFANGSAKTTHSNRCRYHGGHDCDCGKDDYLRAARAFLEANKVNLTPEGE